MGTKIIDDIYYDDAEYHATRQDMWLRMRDGKFEMKVAIEDGGDRYEEVEDENKIKELLQIQGSGKLKDLLEKNNYHTFLHLKKTRRKYKKEGFSIDIDFAESDDGFVCEQMEIELMIEDESKADETAERIVNFAKHYGLKEVNVGKISEYIRNKRPDHYNILKNLGFWPEN